MTTTTEMRDEARFDPAEVEFVERLGRFFEDEGASRIGGRILGLLLLVPGDLPLDEIAERLEVSKASVSTNARMLEVHGVVERVSHLGDRKDYYRIVRGMGVSLVRRRIERLRQLQALLEEGCRTPAAREDEAVGARFRTITAVHGQAMRCMESIIHDHADGAHDGGAAFVTDTRGREAALERE